MSATTEGTRTRARAAGEGDARWFLANLATIKLSGAETGGRFSLVEVMAAAGDMPPLHVHHDDDETFIVLDGEVSLFVGDTAIAGRAGSIVLAPRGVPHTYRVESATARCLVLSAPSSFAEFVTEASEPAGAATLPPVPVGDPARLTAIAAEHGIEILGPPGMLPGGLAA